MLLNEYLSIFAAVSNEERLITSTMINNYVKMKIIPAPVKKKYHKRHLAYMIIVCILKQTLSIPTISQIIVPDLDEDALKAVYASFIHNHQKAFSYVSEQVKAVSTPLLTDDTPESRMEDFVMQVAVSANILKLITGWIANFEEETDAK